MRHTTIQRSIASMATPCLQAGVAFLLFSALPATAWVLTITAGPKAIYLQIGNGSRDANNATVNQVSVSVPAPQLGTGTVQAMTSNSTVSNSFQDGYAVCNPPAQVYVGGYLRAPNTAGQPAVLRVTTPASLTTPAGDTLPFSTISWVSSSNGNGGAADIPSGTFPNGGSLTLRSIAPNRWVENCFTFSYANTNVVPAGTYSGTATFTLTAP